MTVQVRRHEARRLRATADVARMNTAQRQDLLEEWWSLDSDDPGWCDLPVSLRDKMAEQEEFQGNSNDPRYEPLLVMAAMDSTVGVRNDWLERSLQDLGLGDIEVLGEVEAMAACPCCGFLSIRSRGHYEICGVCFWEDDGGDDPNRHSGPNHMSLREGREGFKVLGACSERHVRAVLVDGSTRYCKDEDEERGNDQE